MAIWLLSGCAAERGGVEWREGTRVDSAGVTLVHHAAAEAAAIPTWDGTILLATTVEADPGLPADSDGAAEGLGGAAGGFGFVADVALLADTLFVLDATVRSITVVDPDGRTLRTIGGPGDGPGEFSRFATSLVLTGDTLSVVDWGHGRFHHFRRDGSFLSADPIGGSGVRSWFRVEGDGVVYARTLARYVGEDQRWRGHDLLRRVTEAGTLADTVWTFRYDETDLGGPGRPVLPLLVNAPHRAVLPGGRLAWSTLEDDRVFVHGPDGSLEYVVAMDEWVRRPLAAADESELSRLIGDKLVALGGSRATVEQMGAVQPERLPAITDLRAGPDGTLLVQRMGDVASAHSSVVNSPDPPNGWGGAVWDVLDADGARVARLTLDPRTRLMRITDDRVVGVRHDELGRDQVVLWSLSR